MKTNWLTKKLGEICEISSGFGFPKNIQGGKDGAPFFKVSDMNLPENEIFMCKSNNYLSESAIKKHKYSTSTKGTVIFPKIGGAIATNKKRILLVDSLFDNNVMGITPGINILSKYLYAWLVNFNLSDWAQGAAMPAIRKSSVELTELAFPSLPEQKRIVKILDDVFEEVARAKENAEKNLKNSRELFESHLQGVFEKPSKGWQTCELNDYVRFIDYRGRTPKKTTSGLRLITAKNIKMGFLQKTPEEFINPKDYDGWMTRGIPKKGDVLFTTEAPLANVAQLDTDEKVAFAQRTIIFQADHRKIDSTFLKYLLLSKPIQKKILEKGTGATVQGIKASLLKKIEIYFPESIPEQKTIVKKLDTLSEQTKKLEGIYKQKLADLEELKKSVLKKAFAGEL